MSTWGWHMCDNFTKTTRVSTFLWFFCLITGRAAVEGSFAAEWTVPLVSTAAALSCAVAADSDQDSLSGFHPTLPLDNGGKVESYSWKTCWLSWTEKHGNQHKAGCHISGVFPCGGLGLAGQVRPPMDGPPLDSPPQLLVLLPLLPATQCQTCIVSVFLQRREPHV